MPTTLLPSQAITELSVGIRVRQAANASGCPKTPKLVESNSDIAAQSASAADRISTEVDVSEASTELDGATKQCRSASEFRAQPIPLSWDGRSARDGDRSDALPR
jgi:hypothetical protein